MIFKFITSIFYGFAVQLVPAVNKILTDMWRRAFLLR